jgi:hypothetical protein
MVHDSRHPDRDPCGLRLVLPQSTAISLVFQPLIYILKSRASFAPTVLSNWRNLLKTEKIIIVYCSEMFPILLENGLRFLKQKTLPLGVLSKHSDFQ